MGEWSDYFDDFPEENMANWVNGVFNPQRAAELREREAHALLASAKTAEETAKLHQTVARMIKEGNERARAKK